MALRNRSVPHPLVRALEVVMLNELGDQEVKMLPANRDEVIEAFGL